jgi:serine/threonine-protein kinase
MGILLPSVPEPLESPLMPAQEQQEEVAPSTLVHGYRIEKKLGSGGFGKVYLAWRDERPYALKFIHLESVGEWGWRELYLLLPLALPNVVRLLSHVRWPEEAPEYLVLVMEYVEGRTLYDWAREENPCALDVTGMFLKLVGALEGVHAAGVLHRDLKGENVLVRNGDGALVVVDFGSGASDKAPRVTRGMWAPGTYEYRSPESVRFLRSDSRKEGERYVHAVADELFALGVILYVLLTDEYPFWGGDEWEVLREILLREPTAPHVLDRRVPRALGELCMRLLSKEPQGRPASAGALREELEAALKGADASWKVPLCDGWDEAGRTTEGVPELVARDPEAGWRKWRQQKPRRGRKPPVAQAPEPLPPAPVQEAAPALLPPGEVAAEPAPAPGLEVAPLPESGAPPSSRPSGWPWPRKLLGAGAVLGLLAVLMLGGSHVLGPRSAHDAPPSSPSATQAQAPFLPEASFLPLAMEQRHPVHEVAPPWKPPEAGAGAEPQRADTPAPVTPVTLSKGDTRVKRELKAAGVQPEKRKRSTTLASMCVGMAAAANLACPGAQVRTTPPPEACPPGAVEAMKKLGILGDLRWNYTSVALGGNEPISVQEGPFSMRVGGHWTVGRGPTGAGGQIALPDNTILSGRLYFGEKRVYGRFTEARTPNQETIPVCMELIEGASGRGKRVRGIEPESIEGNTAKVWPRGFDVQAVERFE